MRHETVLQIHGSLLQFFQYGESLMKKAALDVPEVQRPQIPDSPNRSPTLEQHSSPQASPTLEQPSSPQASPTLEQHSSPQASPKQHSSSLKMEGKESGVDTGENVVEQVTTSSGESRKPIKVIKKRKEKENVDVDVNAIGFDEGDFPALGKISLKVPSVVDKEPAIRIATRGNQKQRREDKQKEKMGVNSLIEHDSTLSVDEIPREVK